MNKQQNVVFFIGAGFSAPFGLPVMSNFINMSRDLYFSDPNQYSEIGKTLELIEKYSSVKNYMNVNLHNIEDLLSISYMESLITKDTTLMDSVIKFIKTVINSYTSDVKNGVSWFSEFISNITASKGSSYFNDGVYELKPNGKKCENSSYGIISLNYDLLIENALDKLSNEYGEFHIRSQRVNPFKELFSITKSKSSKGIPMAKLHGSIDDFIVPPTWNKNIHNQIQEDWELAIDLLTDATHVVFLGYSLPPTDNYIKFLLASSLNKNKRLKRISIITMDTDNETEDRYNSLFTLTPNFHNTDISNFFEILNNAPDGIDFDKFDSYFSSYIVDIENKAKV